MKNKILIALVFSVVLVLALFGATTVGWFSLSNQKVIKVGVVYPMTGNASPYGEYAINAFGLSECLYFNLYISLIVAKSGCTNITISSNLSVFGLGWFI